LSNEKQVLTIYNPYSYRLEFKVLGTRPTFYTVRPHSGTLPNGSSINIVVALNSKTISEYLNKTAVVNSKMLNLDKDRFLIELLNDQKVVVGKQVIPIQLSLSPVSSQATLSTPVEPGPVRQSQPSGPNSQAPPRVAPGRPPSSLSIMFVRLLPLIVGVTLILLISSGEIKAFDSYSNLWICFFIGMLTMVIQLKFLELT